MKGEMDPGAVIQDRAPPNTRTTRREGKTQQSGQQANELRLPNYWRKKSLFCLIPQLLLL